MELQPFKRLGIGLFLLFTALAAWIAHDGVQQLGRATASLRDEPFRISEALLQAHDKAFAVHTALHDAIMAPSPAARRLSIAATIAHEDQLRTELSVIAERFTDQPRLLAPLFGTLADFADFRNQVIEMLEQDRNGDAHALMTLQGEKIYRQLHEALSVIFEAERLHAAQLRIDAENAEQAARMASLGLAVLAGGALAVMVLGYKVFVTTHRPLMRLRASLMALAGGQSEIEIPYLDQTSAIGAMARAIQRFKDSLAERDAAHAAVTDALDEARRATEVKSRFLSAASHDLRQPLQAIRLFLDTLDRSVTAPFERRALDGALNALAAGEDLLRNYLHVSVLDSGLIEPQAGLVAIDDVLRQVARECAPKAEAKGLELRIVRCGAVIESDTGLLTQLLTNLVCNAIRFTDHGRVLVGCRRTDRWARIEVWDTGVGIPEDKLSSVFEDFFQIGNDERDRTKGLGLGLSVVDRAARLLGHTVKVRSRLGRGSVFTVTAARSGAVRHLNAA